MPEWIKAPLVLTLICGLVSAALVFANDLTADAIAAAEQARLQESWRDAFGEAEYTVHDLQFDGINQVILDKRGNVIYDITSTGYEKDGQHLLIGLDETGAVSGICVVSIEDSPTQSAKVQQDSFLSQFIGWDAPDHAYDAISGATKSSEGIRRAVALALQTDLDNREVIRNAE